MNAPVTDLLRQLERDGVVEAGTARLIPLTGGVSSDIYRLETGQCDSRSEMERVPAHRAATR